MVSRHRTYSTRRPSPQGLRAPETSIGFAGFIPDSVERQWICSFDGYILWQSVGKRRYHPSLRFGRYVVSRQLGRGGMGIVSEATDPQIGRRLAIKIINFQAFTTVEESAVLRERLFREARWVGALSQRRIVVIYDVGEHNQLVSSAMELVDGPSLH